MAFSQPETIPDTLDWTGYYPLQIGNCWESLKEILIASERLEYREIIGDTLINEHRYFIQAEVIDSFDPVNGIDQTQAFRTYLRYDSLETRLVAWSERDSRDVEYSPNLSSDFGAETDHYSVLGGYNEDMRVLRVGSDSVHYRAEKTFFNLGGGATYFHGVGFWVGVGDGQAGSSRLTYLRLNGIEYGERVFSVNVEEEQVVDRIKIQMYPNPASINTNLRITLPETGAVNIEVYDILGRKLTDFDSGILIMGRHDISLDLAGLVQGRYMVRIKIGDEQAGLPLMIVR